MPGQFQHNFFLLRKERQIQRQNMLLQKFRYLESFAVFQLQRRHHMLRNDQTGNQRFQTFVKNVFLTFDFHAHQRPLGAQSHTAGRHNANLVLQVVLLNRVLQQGNDVVAARRLAAGGMTTVNRTAKTLQIGVFVLGNLMDVKSFVNIDIGHRPYSLSSANLLRHSSRMFLTSLGETRP